MRAAVVEALGQPPELAERSHPTRGAGQALVEVAAAPINPIDISIATGRFYAGRPQVPYVPGKEGVGEVLEADSLAPGTRVYFPMPGGLGGDGALAELVSADEASATPVPDGVDDALAACFGVAGMAAWLALEWRAKVQVGESVLVLGASGAVGQIAVQAAKLLGAGRVVAAARDAGGLERARELGADAVVDLSAHRGADALAEAFREAAGGEIDVTVDPLWGEPAAAAAQAGARWGRLVQIGQSASPEATLPSAAVRGKLLSILGHNSMATPQDVLARAYRRMVEHAAEGGLTVDHEIVPLDGIAGAWERQAAFPRRKIVVRP